MSATGLCLSDWHGWMGHDPDITLPHVPGHELAGVVEAVGRNVTRWRPGDRVTLPFVCGCGGCPQCASGNHQICDRQFQPGFTHWGSFAQWVAIDYADVNLVRLPDEITDVAATCLNSIAGLRKRGRHVQVGLMTGALSQPAIPMAQIIANELVILGSHGIQAHRYGPLLDMIRSGKLAPEKLVGQTVPLTAVPALLPAMDRFSNVGVAVVDMNRA